MDARTRYTNMVIKNSFLTLLREKPLGKITVTAICELSEINRATFYRYYSDPFDLLERIEAEVLIGLQKLLEQANPDNTMETITVIMLNMRESYEIYSALISENGDPNFKTKILSLCYQTIEADGLSDIPKVQREWYYYFLAQGCGSILDFWVRNGMREEPQEVSAFIARLTQTLQKSFT